MTNRDQESGRCEHARHPTLFGHELAMPYGVLDLDPAIIIEAGPPIRVQCFVQGCQQFLIPPTRDCRGEVCRVHGIRCHRSSTYSYPDVRRNTIVAAELLATRIVGHPFKFESHRLGSEKSEDMLSFNVFRSFQEAGLLNYIGRHITGLDEEDEPRLFLWGIELSEDSLRPWDLLIGARERFERQLPVKRPYTEPDIGLYLPGRYLILIEAKFTSPNSYYADGPRKDSQSLTKNELLDIYSDRSLRYLDQELAAASESVFYQLWRNVVFSEWMARKAQAGTQAYFANLTRRFCETESFNHFRVMLRPEFAGRVAHICWEDLHVIASLGGSRLSILQEYLLTKTANLLPAFDFDF